MVADPSWCLAIFNLSQTQNFFLFTYGNNLFFTYGKAKANVSLPLCPKKSYSAPSRPHSPKISIFSDFSQIIIYSSILWAGLTSRIRVLESARSRAVAMAAWPQPLPQPLPLQWIASSPLSPTSPPFIPSSFQILLGSAIFSIFLAISSTINFNNIHMLTVCLLFFYGGASCTWLCVCNYSFNELILNSCLFICFFASYFFCFFIDSCCKFATYIVEELLTVLAIYMAAFIIFVVHCFQETRLAQLL